MYRPTEGEGTSAGEGRGDPAVDLPQQAQTILVTVRCRVHRVQDPDPDGAGLDEEPAPGHEALGALDRDGDDPAAWSEATARAMAALDRPGSRRSTSMKPA